jgi:hypothetical protein
MPVGEPSISILCLLAAAFLKRTYAKPDSRRERLRDCENLSSVESRRDETAKKTLRKSNIPALVEVDADVNLE